MKKTDHHSALIPSLLSRVEVEAVREQLARVLASPSFRNSKRYPEFLRYTVEHALIGETENIKERTLGIEVFGRDPNYDTNLDPVVRMTAAEVRKRIEQYYQARGRENEIHIDFSRGSYVPEFRFPGDIAIPSPAPAAVILPLKAEAKYWHWMAWLTAACAVLGAGLWGAASSRRTVLDQFWSPVMDSQAPVLLCIPDLSTFASHMATIPQNQRPAGPFGIIDQFPLGFQRDEVSFVDSFVLTKVAGALGKKGRSFRLFHTEDATLDDLKQGPAVLIGGTNNPWINQVSSELRFSLADDGPLRYISDRQNSSSRQWGLTRQGPPSKVDYAVISRVFNPTTGQPVVIAAGAHLMGTEAAGECFADPQCFDNAAKLAPGDWLHENVQIVVQAEVINEHPGQPHVLAAYLWQH